MEIILKNTLHYSNALKNRFLKALTQTATNMYNKVENEITRDNFMNFFRNSEKLTLLSVDDRIEVFSTILLGSSDFKKGLFDSIFSDYCITNLEIIEVG